MAVNVKHDWYQTETNLVINILHKNTNKEDIEVKCLEDSLSVSFTESNGGRATLDLKLAHCVEPLSCIARWSNSKIELKLVKKEGIRWTHLQAEEPTQVCGPPAYPSSSSKAKDWNQVEAEINKEEEKEKPEGEAALNSLFQKIYCQGSDEVKKAMNKSFSESGGTVLSTNWNEVERDKIQVKAPDGMEWKEWDS